MAKRTYDAMALELMLNGQQAKLEALAQAVRDRMDGKLECPECGDTDQKEHNGDTREPSWLCLACGYSFDEKEV